MPRVGLEDYAANCSLQLKLQKPPKTPIVLASGDLKFLVVFGGRF